METLDLTQRTAIETCNEAPTLLFLKTRLKPHQSDSLRWFLMRENDPHTKGGMLFDDCGMGKSIQMISLVLSDTLPTKTLIVCPANLIENWKIEFKKHARLSPSTVVSYHGTNRSGVKMILAQDKKRIVITSYGVLSSEIGMDNWMTDFDWDRVILDEAHKIRNRQNKSTFAVWSLKAERRWALTATPFFNAIQDLYSYFRFLGLHQTYSEWSASVDKTRKGIRELHRLLKSFAIRRMKHTTIQLPSKTETSIVVSLSEEEREFYDCLLEYSEQRILNLLKRSETLKALAKTNKDIKKTGMRSIYKNCILTFILRLRQCCCNPALVLDTMKRLNVCGDLESAIRVLKANITVDQKDECPVCMDTEADRRANCGHACCDECWERIEERGKDRGLVLHCPMCRQVVTELTPLITEKEKQEAQQKPTVTYTSTKITMCMDELAERFGNGQKVLVGSQWVKFLKQVIAAFKDRFPDTNFAKVTGELSMNERQEELQRFRTDPNTKVVFISSTASAEGINLVEATHVIHLEPYWNCMLDYQLGCRTHRIGQTKEVTVSHYRVSDTIECNMQKLINRKDRIGTTAMKGWRWKDDDADWAGEVVKLLSRDQLENAGLVAKEE